MSAASRTIQATPGTRQVGPALLALALLLTLGVLLAYGTLTAAKPAGAAGAAAPIVHDHGWSSASTSRRAAIDAGRHRPKTRVVPAAGSGSGAAGIVVKGANGGGIVYTGIPYPAPGAASAGDTKGSAGSTRIRLAR